MRFNSHVDRDDKGIKQSKSVLLEGLASLVERLAALVSSLVEWFTTLIEGLSSLVLTALVEGLATLVTTERLASLVIEGLSALVLSPLVERLASLLVVVAVLVVEGPAALVSAERLSSLIATEGLATLLSERLSLGPVLLDMLLGDSSCTFLFIIIVVLIVLIIIVIIDVVVNVLIVVDFFEVLIIVEILIFVIVILFRLGWLDRCCCLLLRLARLGLLLRRLGLLLGRLRFLLGRSDLGCRLLGNNLLFLTLFFEFIFIIRKIKASLLIGLEEAGQMDSSVTLNGELNLIEQRDEEVNNGVRALLGEGGDQEVVTVVLDPERCSLLGGGCEDNIGEGKHFALRLLNVARVELEGRAGVDDLSKEHS